MSTIDERAIAFARSRGLKADCADFDGSTCWSFGHKCTCVQDKEAYLKIAHREQSLALREAAKIALRHAIDATYIPSRHDTMMLRSDAEIECATAIQYDLDALADAEEKNANV